MKEQFYTAIFSLLTLVVTWVSIQARAWIAAKVKNETAKGILGRLDDTVEAAVKEVEQTVLSSLTTVSPGDLSAAKTAALKTIESHLGAKGIAELMAVLGMTDASALGKYLETQLEAKVLDLKTQCVLPSARTPAAA